MPLTYTPDTFVASGTFDYTNANNIETGISTLYDLLNGVKTDAAVLLHYAPGAAGSPVLSLQTDGNVGLLKGLEADGTTEAFTIDATGNMTLAGNIILGANDHIYGANGNNYIKFSQSPDDIVIAPGATNWTYFNAALNAHIDSNGYVYGARVYDNSNRVAIQGAHSLGQPIVSYGTATPTSLAANEVYFQI